MRVAHCTVELKVEALTSELLLHLLFLSLYSEDDVGPDLVLIQGNLEKKEMIQAL